MSDVRADIIEATPTRRVVRRYPAPRFHDPVIDYGFGGLGRRRVVTPGYFEPVRFVEVLTFELHDDGRATLHTSFQVDGVEQWAVSWELPVDRQEP